MVAISESRVVSFNNSELEQAAFFKDVFDNSSIDSRFHSPEYATAFYTEIILRKYYEDDDDFAFAMRGVNHVLDRMDGKKRGNGIPYSIHPLDSFLRLTGLEPPGSMDAIVTLEDFARIYRYEPDEVLLNSETKRLYNRYHTVALFLHDNIEDKVDTEDVIVRQFGTTVLTISQAMSYLSSGEISKIDTDEREAYVTKEQVALLAKDPIVLALKLGGDLASNAATIQYLPSKGELTAPERQKAKAREYLNRFAKLLLELRIDNSAQTLDNLFYYAYPEEYEQISLQRSQFISDEALFQEELAELFSDSHLGFFIRYKQHHSQHREDRGSVEDLFSFRYEQPSLYESWQRISAIGESPRQAFAPSIYCRCENEDAQDLLRSYLARCSFNARSIDASNRHPITHHPDVDHDEIRVWRGAGLRGRFISYTPQNEWMYIPLDDIVKENRNESENYARQQLMARYDYYFSIIFANDLHPSLQLKIFDEESGRNLMRLYLYGWNGRWPLYIPREACLIDVAARLQWSRGELTGERLPFVASIYHPDSSNHIVEDPMYILHDHTYLEIIDVGEIEPLVSKFQRLKTFHGRYYLYLMALECIRSRSGNTASCRGVVREFESMYAPYFSSEKRRV